MTEFRAGQRWLSETETELGLGIIEDVGHRLVSIYFPACEESRTYAKDNAPLTRIQFRTGDSITTADGEYWFVIDTETVDHILYYEVHAEGDPDTRRQIPETRLSHQLHLSHAVDRLLSKQIDSPRWFALRYAALQALERSQRSPVKGLVGARTSLIPHQLYIADEVASRYAPRVLLADEVGLGKTIEAGLIIHQQLLTHRARRVLIVVPQQLVHQWFVEMIRRFNLHFAIFDAERLQAVGEVHALAMGDEFDTELAPATFEDVQNPFLTEQLVLCSSDFLIECDFDPLLNGEWDLMVIDEAHHLQWSEATPSAAYLRVAELARVIPGLLLLTATPEQLGLESHFSRLHLLDPARFASLEAFRREQAQHQETAALIEELDASDEWSPALKQKLSAMTGEDQLREHNREQVISELIDRHGTGRVLFRNTRRTIAGFPRRVVHGHALECPPLIREALPAEIAAADVSLLLSPEIAFGDDSWCRIDSRLAWLETFLKQHRREKVLVICAHKSTAVDIESHLRFRSGLNVSVFHEEMDIVSRDRAAAYFADAEDGAQALVCSEIGSEGRNFQFARLLVLFDLPLNPDLLEQRIGRLDRIGQAHDIHIHVPYYADHAQQVLFRWYHEGCNAFETTNVAGTLTFEQCEAHLHETLAAIEQQDALIETTRTIAQAARERLEAGRDRLLELGSFKAVRAAELVESIVFEDENGPQNFLEAVFDRYGVDMEFHSRHCFVVQPGDHMFATFPHLPEDGVTVTFERDTALQRDDIRFLTWEHPMVTDAIDLVLGQEKGSACFTTLRTEGVKPGTVLLEAVYALQAFAPRHLQVDRFMPLSIIRTLTDMGGKDIGKGVSHERLNQLTSKVDKTIARQAIDQMEEQLQQMCKHSQRLAHERATPIIQSALDSMRAEQAAEIARLSALQKKNPAIRDEEITFLKTQQEQLEAHILEAQTQLEGLRVIVAM